MTKPIRIRRSRAKGSAIEQARHLIEEFGSSVEFVVVKTTMQFRRKPAGGPS